MSKKVCPLLVLDRKEPGLCIEVDCAWWVSYEKSCAIKVLGIGAWIDISRKEME